MKILAPLLVSLVITSSTRADTFTVPGGDMLCDDNGSILKQVADEYKEKPIAIGKGSKEVRMAVLFNEKTKTWTILGLKDNITCILAAGTDLQLLPHKTIKHYVMD